MGSAFRNVRTASSDGFSLMRFGKDLSKKDSRRFRVLGLGFRATRLRVSSRTYLYPETLQKQ